MLAERIGQRLPAGIEDLPVACGIVGRDDADNDTDVGMMIVQRLSIIIVCASLDELDRIPVRRPRPCSAGESSGEAAGHLHDSASRNHASHINGTLFECTEAGAASPTRLFRPKHVKVAFIYCRKLNPMILAAFTPSRQQRFSLHCRFMLRNIDRERSPAPRFGFAQGRRFARLRTTEEPGLIPL